MTPGLGLPEQLKSTLGSWNQLLGCLKSEFIHFDLGSATENRDVNETFSFETRRLKFCSRLRRDLPRFSQDHDKTETIKIRSRDRDFIPANLWPQYA